MFQPTGIKSLRKQQFEAMSLAASRKAAADALRKAEREAKKK